MHQRVGAGGAAGDDLQLPADAALNAVRDGQQLLHLLRRGLGGAVARQVHANAGQNHMGQLPLYVNAHVHHLVLVPEPLPQVAQVGHDDDAVGLALKHTLLLQRVQRDALALEGRFAQAHHVRQLGKPGNADQQPWPADTGGAALFHLFQTAGTQFICAALAQGTRHLRQAVRALYHAADADVPVMTAADNVLGVAAQRGEVDLQLWISAIHANTSCIIIS